MSVGPPLAPVGDVVALAVRRGPVTAREGTAPVSRGEGDGLAGGGDPGGAAEVERDALAVLDQDVQGALVAESQGVADREQGAVLGDRQPVLVAELGVFDVPDGRGRGPAAGGQVAEFRMALRTSPNASCIRTSCGRASRVPGISTTPPSPGPASDSSLGWSGCSAHPRSVASVVAGTAGAGLDQASSTTRAASPVSWSRSACRVYPACPRFFHNRSPRCLCGVVDLAQGPVGVGPDHHLPGQHFQVGRGHLGRGGGHLGLHHRSGVVRGPGRAACRSCPG